MAENVHVSSVVRKLSNSSEKSIYFCSEKDCDKEFKRKDRLIIHLRTHTGERPFKCEELGCNKSYCRQPHLLRHQRNAHGPSAHKQQSKSFQFQCKEDGCGRVFTQEHNLQKHFRLQHSPESAHKYKCDVEGCEEVFRKHHQLRAHSYTHTNVDPYRCSHPGCLRTFATTTRLRRHLKVHEGYQCDQEGCEQSFSKWSELRAHKDKDHVEEHVCKECSKTFPKRHLLNSHHRLHHDERSPLPCTHKGCDRMYWDKRNLKAHIRRYHERERFFCDVSSCGKTFAFKQTLNEHMKTHSPDFCPPERTCKVKKMHSKKPRKQPSAASKISGVVDMEVCHDLNYVTLENTSPECLIEPKGMDWSKSVDVGDEVIHRQDLNQNKESDIIQNRGINMQANNIQIQHISVQDITQTCVNMSNCNIPISQSLFSGDLTGKESMEFGEKMNRMENNEFESRPECSVSHPQKNNHCPRTAELRC